MKKHSAFTMIELIFVIVIMGILGKFGVEFMANAYRSFIFTKVNNELLSNSASAVEFIAKRLQYRIRDSVIARQTKLGAPIKRQDMVSSTDYLVMEWVGADNDGFRGRSMTGGVYLPTWSAIIDINPSTPTALQSPMTNTADINATIADLSGSTSSIADAALYFIGSINDPLKGYGWDGDTTLIDTQKGTMHPITSTAVSTQFASSTGTNFTDVSEFYKLAWTAYAIVNESGTLKLYWNYQPWLGEHYYSAPNVKSSTIMDNVSSFEFFSKGSSIKIHVCTKTTLVEDYSLCKEKTIL